MSHIKFQIDPILRANIVHFWMHFLEQSKLPSQVLTKIIGTIPFITLLCIGVLQKIYVLF